MRYLFFVLILFSIGCSKENDSPYSDVYDDIKGTWKQDWEAQNKTYTDIYVFSEPKDSNIKVTYEHTPNETFDIPYFIDKGSGDFWIMGLPGWRNIGKATFKNNQMLLDLGAKDKPFYK